MSWVDLIGCEPDEFCRRAYARRPEWVRGMIGLHDATFLFERALAAAPTTVAEIGTASGFSAAFLAHALELTDRANGRSGSRLFTYDILEFFYRDENTRIGDAAREMLRPETLERVTFRNPATSLDAAKEHAPETLEFLFIDANHSHPWPALDLLAMLDALHSGAEVVLHDINLPVKHPNYQNWGAKWLYEGLDLEKQIDTRDPVPNIGSVSIPADKDGLGEHLREIVHAHEWERPVPHEVTAPLLT